MSSKKKKKPPSSDGAKKACKHCERGQEKLYDCARCGLVVYCGKDCQQADWKVHRPLCIPKADRRPGAVEQAEDPQRFEGKDKCPICIEPIHPADGMNLMLPCKHVFHGLCVASLRVRADAQVCPMCREDLPPGPDVVYKKAIDICVFFIKKVERGLT